MLLSRINILALSLLFLLFSACNEPSVEKPEPEWNLAGLGGKTVHQVHKFENWLYVGTSGGVFRKNLGLSSSEWVEVGLTGQNVKAMYIYNLNTILAEVMDVQSPANSMIYKTVNGGTIWEAKEGGFGGETSEGVYHFGEDTNDRETVFAVGNGVISKSEDLGETWTVVYGAYGATEGSIEFVEVNPQNSQEVWAGGHDSSQNGILLHSMDAGVNWELISDLRPNPSSAKTIMFDETNGQLLLGWGSGLLRSKDNGDSWDLILDTSLEGRAITAIQVDQFNMGTLYAAGWLNLPGTPQDLVLFESKDNGISWNQMLAPNPGALFGGVKAMALLQDEYDKIIYFGLHKGGIYKLRFP